MSSEHLILALTQIDLCCRDGGMWWQGLMQESLMLFMGQLVQFGGLLAARQENKQVAPATVIVTQVGFTLK